MGLVEDDPVVEHALDGRLEGRHRVVREVQLLGHTRTVRRCRLR